LAENGVQQEVEACFTETFGVLKRCFDSNALRRYENGRHSGRMGLAAFECIAVGVGKNINAIGALQDPDEFVREKITTFWEHPELERFISQGMRGTTRIQRTVPFGEEWFRP